MGATYRDPVRNVNQSLLSRLSLESTKVYDLPGGTGPRQQNALDPRLTSLNRTVGGQVGDVVVYYEHIATVRDTVNDIFFIAFRETMDAFLARQTDPKKFPKWLMEAPEKQAERKIHIYAVKCHPSKVSIMRSHEDWLTPINDDSVFDTVAYFLHQNKVVTDQMYKSIR